MTATGPTGGSSAYLALQQLARRSGRPTQELLVLYALEGLLNRIAGSTHREQLVLKGGMLLAAIGGRRPTRDIDLHGRRLSADVDEVLHLVRAIASVDRDDGLRYDLGSATARPIRDHEPYRGVRIGLDATLHTARLRTALDISVGDPMWPGPQVIDVPRLLGGAPIRLLGHPVEMVVAEKLVTALARGAATTRWRDLGDVLMLIGAHPMDATRLRRSIDLVLTHRLVRPVPIGAALVGLEDVGRAGWSAWRASLPTPAALPATLADVIAELAVFADPLLVGDAAERGLRWDPGRRRWT